MKIQLIKLQDKFILVSDEEIIPYLEYDEANRITFVLHVPSNTIMKCNGIGEMNGSKTVIYSDFMHGKEVLYKDCKKIIAVSPKLPLIDFSLLSEEDCKTIGWVDVEKLALKYAKTYIEDDGTTEVDFKEGFKAAQALNDKIFSLKDMQDIFEEGLNWWGNGRDTDLTDADSFFERYIQSLQQPKAFDVEVEMEECCKPMPNIHIKWYQPKIIDNTIKIIKII